MEDKITENMSKINDLLESKNISVMDDLIQDIFIDDETDERILYIEKLDEDAPLETQLEITETILNTLTSYKNDKI